MHRVLIAFATVAVALTAGMQPGNAEPRPYCLHGDDDSPGGGIPDCTYYTWEQCRASISGGRDYCMENPALAWRRLQQPPRPVPQRRVRERN